MLNEQANEPVNEQANEPVNEQANEPVNEQANEPKNEPFDYKTAYESLVSRLDKLENKDNTPKPVQTVRQNPNVEVEDFDTYCYNHFDKKKRR